MNVDPGVSTAAGADAVRVALIGSNCLYASKGFGTGKLEIRQLGTGQ